MPRVRHCVECPNCHTRYLLAFSPYGNGSYIVPTMYGSTAEYTLYCACKESRVVSRWRWSETAACEVSKSAYERGYGSGDEILEARRQQGREDLTSCLPLAGKAG